MFAEAVVVTRGVRILSFAIIAIYSLLIITAVSDTSNEPREMLLYFSYALVGLACGVYFLFSLTKFLSKSGTFKVCAYAALLGFGWVLTIVWLNHAVHTAEAVKILTSAKYSRCKEKAVPIDSGMLAICNDKQSWFMGSNNFFEIIIYDTSAEAGLPPLKRSGSWLKALRLPVDGDIEKSFKNTVSIRHITGDYYLIAYNY